MFPRSPGRLGPAGLPGAVRIQSRWRLRHGREDPGKQGQWEPGQPTPAPSTRKPPAFRLSISSAARGGGSQGPAPALSAGAPGSIPEHPERRQVSPGVPPQNQKVPRRCGGSAAGPGWSRRNSKTEHTAAKTRHRGQAGNCHGKRTTRPDHSGCDSPPGKGGGLGQTLWGPRGIPPHPGRSTM